MTEQHTPGPWKYTKITFGHPNNSRNAMVTADGYNIARLFSETATLDGMTSLGPPQKIAEANARLVEAAPELFRELMWILDGYDSITSFEEAQDFDWVSWAERVRPIIDRVRGE